MSKLFNPGIAKIPYIIILLMAAGFALRIIDLGVLSLWLDEAISANAATSLLENGIPVLPSGFVYTRAILNTFFIALSFEIFGVSEFAARLPSVLFGTLTILLVYLSGSKWGNRRVGIIAALLVAFSVWEIAWSRQARMYQQLQFFYILSLYLFYEFTRNKDLKNLALLICSFLATVMSHELGYGLILVFLVFFVISALKEQGSIKKLERRIITLIALGFGILLGIAYYMGVVQSVLQTDINYYNIYIYLLKKDLGIFLFLAVPGGKVIVDRDWKKGTLLIAALIIPLYFIFFHVLLLGTRYLYFVIPILFILIGFFLDFVIEYLKLQWDFFHNELSKNATAEVIVALVLILTMYFSPAFTFVPKEKYDLGVNAPQSNFKDAYIYVKNNMRQDDVIISAWTPPAQFYLGKSDYWLEFNVVGTGAESFLMENSSKELYTNATAISDVEALAKAVDEHAGGWVIVDKVAWYKLRPSVRDFIRNNLTFYIESGKIDTVEVYGWYNGKEE